MCDIAFEKAKGRGGKVSKQNECRMQKQPPEGFFKKGVMRNFVEFTRKHLGQNLFFD